MTHELKQMFTAYAEATLKHQKTVLATVVALQGSSYRKPGVRMLLVQNGKATGAVSGGCVEKEIIRQARQVFVDDVPKVMTYDGRYRLGCEGILHILIEPFRPSAKLVAAFTKNLKLRSPFEIIAHFSKEESYHNNYGSFFNFDDQKFGCRSSFNATAATLTFKQVIRPSLKLIIFGAEHDAVQLCLFASLSGWEVIIVAPLVDEKNIENFSGANQFLSLEPDQFKADLIDQHTAVVVMNHSYARDLRWLLAISKSSPQYIGLLGPAHRRERVIEALVQHQPDISERFLDCIHGPAGLNIGSETPQEIALAILSEILSVYRETTPIPLKDKAEGVHT